MKPLIRTLYRQTSKAIATLATAEEQALARNRFIEFLPPTFVVNQRETLQQVTRRAFRHRVQSEAETLTAITQCFAFLKSFAADRSEIEVLAHWVRNDMKSWIVGASIISYGYQGVRAPTASGPTSLPSASSSRQVAPTDTTATTTPLGAAATSSANSTFRATDSFSTFLQRVNLQIDAIVERVRSQLITEQIAVMKRSVMKPPKRKRAKKNSGLATISEKSRDAVDVAVDHITQKATSMRKEISGLDETRLLANVDIESIVRALIYVLLEEMKFTAVTVSPLEGFLVDRVLESRLGSASLLSLLFTAVGAELGLQCAVTMDQRCPMVRVEGFRGLTCFVNLADGGRILSSEEALEVHMKLLQDAALARVALKAAEPKVVFCGIIASALVVAIGKEHSRTSMETEARERRLLKAQLIYLSSLKNA